MGARVMRQRRRAGMSHGRLPWPSQPPGHGSSQPAKAKPDNSCSHDWFTISQMFSELFDLMSSTQIATDEHFMMLKTLELQGRSLKEKSCLEAIDKQRENISHWMSKTVNFLWDKSVPFLGFKNLPPVIFGGDVTHRQSDFKVTVINHFLSKRGSALLDSCLSMFQGYEAYPKDKYHEDKNPLGFLNLGTIENKLCLDLMTERLCQSDMNSIKEDQLQYPEDRGQLFLREEVARFLTYYCKAPSRLDPENVVVLNSCSSVFSALTMVLSDPGEAFLVPVPFYGGFTFSSHLFAKVELIPVYLETKVTSEKAHVLQITVDKLEVMLLDARVKGKIIRGIVLTNPQNSLAGIDSQYSLMECLSFAEKYVLHVIIDESCMLSVFGEDLTFHSVLSLTSLPDPERTHVIWDASLDFGIAGFCLSALYTHNSLVASAMRSFGCLHGVSGITQYKLGRLLQDRGWIDEVYLPTNHSRLREAHKYVTSKLEALEIPFLPCSSGLSVWINLKDYLYYPATFEEEELLYHRFLESKLILSHGKSFSCKKPGWFHLVFAEKHNQLQEGVRRFLLVLEEQKQDRIERLLEDALRESDS
ncbi:probable inactive 1-aminocyclopropane-1-carboxylate synthase-like protein 2 [Dipodomys spectabilis]|uniref:probable inactive 1-aminocyclopropane-1-carboxylate synthase-like protein 2 n=1 Tax=Dipodomys spectabilis TaxID=105255 RepID=UPI001C541BAE|nr:probable inactive 1-aminocyclopropane-1-carboxylate synthase-like protein 2 [Dipodomys spectabilis]